ncbi:MAG: UDP-N-acetylmuramoyl-L-alanyl-D-glutamate--2,6-diaminopimelate ligase [Traorella sp.]
MKCSDLFTNAPDIEIKTLFYDSRNKVEKGMFFCMDGLVYDGHQFISQAIENGAVCIVHHHEVLEKQKGIVYIRVEDVSDTMAKVASRFYDYPSNKLKIYGVTGTNGKSTITKVIKDVHSRFEACGYIGTISINYQDVTLPPTLTTPDALYLQKVLSDMVNANVKACALEVSSHGLEQNRVNGINFDVVVFTNLTHDHLDFHGTFENYLNAKKKLFQMVSKDAICVINKDDAAYEAIKDACNGKVITYGVQNDCDYRADDIELSIEGTKFNLIYEDKAYFVETNLVALYNVYNLLAAIAAMHQGGLPLENILEQLNDLKQVDGRLERIDEGQPFNVIVDFAHTPDGFEKIFEYAKLITPENSNIISVFGSAGRRDKKKRKIMGNIADHYCSNIILTDDDPRDEDPSLIASEIKSGTNHANVVYISQRQDAIRLAIEMAKPKDTILILGKGDEEFIAYGMSKEPYIGDHNAAKIAIKKYYLEIEEKENEEE